MGKNESKSGENTGEEAGSRPSLLPGENTAREWAAPRSISSLALERMAGDAPVARRAGSKAELAAKRAALVEAERTRDADAERTAASNLARALVATGAELDRATRLARRALMLGEDHQLRRELSGWFAGLGEPALAAATLAPVADAEQGAELARVLVRTAVFHARDGDAEQAAANLASAAKADPDDPLPSELLAGVGCWAPDAVNRNAAAEAYLDGARRRERLGDRVGAFEDVLRAFETSPRSPVAAEALVVSLGAAGRRAAADEVLREHADSAGARATSVHQRRVRDAAAEGDFETALGAAFDARADAELDVEAVVAAVGRRGTKIEPDAWTFDDLLLQSGLGEVVAARLELAVAESQGQRRAGLCRVLAGLYATTLGSPERAVERWVDALVADPSDEDAKAALRELAATTGDPSALVDALVAVGRGSHEDAAARLACLRELTVLADQRLGDPSLALWGSAHLERLGEFDEDLEKRRKRWEGGARLQEVALASARRALLESDGDARIEPLRQLVAALKGRPDHGAAYLDVLLELSQRARGERHWANRLERRLRLSADRAGMEAHHQASLEHADPATQGRVRRALGLVALSFGDFDGALGALTPAPEGPTLSALEWALVLALGARSTLGERRPGALHGLIGSLPPSWRAVLGAVAAEQWLEYGVTSAARSAAEQACQADPSRVRAVVALARTSLDAGDRIAAVALERAMSVGVPRAKLCRALGRALDELGDADGALAWTQRWLTLRPGDAVAEAALLERVLRGADAARIADALSYLLAQNKPLSALAPEFARALAVLSEADPPRGVAMARRVLDVFGLREPVLRDAVLGTADAAEDAGLAIALLERELAFGTPGEARTRLLLEVAERRQRMGDADGSARALVRALDDGAAPEQVSPLLEGVGKPRSTDGELSLLEARAEVWSASPEGDLERTAQAWRELGAARWDLALDHEGAIAAWERAAALDPERGVERFARDVASFGGTDEARARLEALAARREDEKEAAHVLAVASLLAIEAGDGVAALDIALRALTLDPRRADLLALAERAAGSENIELLEQAYATASASLLGTYGERALHYRAARQFERRGEFGLALKHAVVAFEAVPAEGVTFVLMMRLAERATQSADAVHAIERVASRSKTPQVQAAWLRRAALVTGAGEEGKRQRVDVLLRALAATPDRDTLRSLGTAIDELVRVVPEDREIFELRLSHALTSMLPRLDGPDGARVAIHAALTSLYTFGMRDMALSCMERAARCDASVDEFKSLEPQSVQLAGAPDASESFVQLCLRLAEERYSNAGRPLLELGATIASDLGQPLIMTRLLVQAARRDPEDDALRGRAEKAAKDLGDADLISAALSVTPPAKRVRALIEAAREAQLDGDPNRAVQHLEQALETEGVDDAAALEIRRLLIPRLTETDQLDRLDVVVGALLGSDEIGASERASLLRTRASTQSARGDHVGAFETLRAIIEQGPETAELLLSALDSARAAGQPGAQSEMLARLVELATDAPTRVARLVELSLCLEAAGDHGGAIERHRQLLEIAPDHLPSLQALQADAHEREDWDALVDLLGRRVAVTTDRTKRRALLLERALLLDARLGQPEVARDTLEHERASGGDADLALLTRLADLHERTDGRAKAAVLLEQAAGLATDVDAVASLVTRAAAAHLEGGDLVAARRVLADSERFKQTERLAMIRVELARRSEKPAELAHRLEELARVSSAPAEGRSEMLVEASRASEAAGDAAGALKRAQLAARVAPASPVAQLLARTLEYRQRGAGTTDSALTTIAELRTIGGKLTPEQGELRAFLLAEALDLGVGHGAGLRELHQSQAGVGRLPLVALGIAERYARASNAERSFALFDVALQGELRDLRSRGEVALLAAVTAQRLREYDKALRYLDIAVTQADTHARGLALQAEIRTLQARTSAHGVPMASHEPLAPAPHEAVRLHGPISQAAALRPRLHGDAAIANTLSGDDFQAHTVRRAPASAPSDSSVLGEQATLLEKNERPSAAEALAELARAQGAGQDDTIKAFAGDRTLQAGPAGAGLSRTLPVGATAGAAQPSDGPPAARDSMPSLSRTASGAFELGRTSVVPGGSLRTPAIPAGSESEASLLAALEAGSAEAGRELARSLEADPTRSHDWVGVCRRLALLLPGDRGVLEQLHRAAIANKDDDYGAAVEHVQSAFDKGGAPPEPPPLRAQVEQPDRVQAMLFRDRVGPGCEALGLVWEGAQHVFRRDPASYGVTGLERLAPTAPTPLARVYSSASRLLGASRTPLFQLRGQDAVSVAVALLNPPALILTGDVVEESSELRFHVGAMLAATLPQHVILYGAPEEEVGNVFDALVAAFGPPQRGRDFRAVASLAEMLWESIPARSQRRLRQLCDEPERLDYASALLEARHAVRRAGLFVSGDLRVAVRETCADEGIGTRALEQPGGLAALCAASPAIADLVQLATSPEYADSRFREQRGHRVDSRPR